MPGREIVSSKVVIFPRVGGGALECNLMGRRCPFFKSLHNPFRKKCILIPCLGIFKFQNNRKTIEKTIAYCSRIFAKFKYFAKKIILTESPDHVLKMIYDMFIFLKV